MIIMKRNVTNCKYAHANRDGGAAGEGGSAGRALLATAVGGGNTLSTKCGPCKRKTVVDLEESSIQ